MKRRKVKLLDFTSSHFYIMQTFAELNNINKRKFKSLFFHLLSLGKNVYSTRGFTTHNDVLSHSMEQLVFL